MNPKNPAPIDFEHPVSRTTVLALLYTALRIKEFRFARQAALSWLATFPGDLEINFILGQAMFGEERYSSVPSIVEDLCAKDPEFLAAQQLRTQPQVTRSQETRDAAFASLHALNGSIRSGINVPQWARQTWEARKACQTGDLPHAEQLIHQALVAESPNPLPAILHLQMARLSQDWSTLNTLSELYHSRWPECLQFKLFQCEALIQRGDEAGSVSLLHQCAALDAAGQVSTRIWGQANPYRSLWPSRLEIMFDLPIPASMAAAMGWNQLASGPASPAQPSAASASKAKMPTEQTRMPPEVLRQIQAEFERLGRRLRRPDAGRSDSRFPVYVILSAHHGLESLYGPQTAGVIEAEMKNLANAIIKRQTWSAITFLSDDANSLAPYGIKPVAHTDPWKIKLTLNDLDTALAKKGQMIGALLIVGGPEVIPFHRLPNPTNDGDPEVASDNPYASLDQNYFVPDWPVGRLPGGIGSDAGLLLAALRRAVSFHTRQSGSSSWWRRSSLLNKLAHGFKKLTPKALVRKDPKPSYGCSAAVWKQSSQAVFRPIGDPAALMISPSPAYSASSHLVPARLGYFNLHGLEDGADWYGQRDITETATGPDYPVALSPKDIPLNGECPRIVFSEACYGANIINKSEEQSICLKFLAAGTLAMVGSTCVSYGAVTTPLIAADLMGYTFWKAIKAGRTAGEAFAEAKVTLVNEMNKRQGYLDGEDQKTLISFNLFGDPLAVNDEFSIRSKSVARPYEHLVVRAISDLNMDEEESTPVPAEMLVQVKKLVGQYLPGLQDADLLLNPQQPMMDEEGHAYAVPQMGARHSMPKQVSRNTVIRLSKQVEFARQVHRQYARLTIDPKGRLVKLSISR